MSHPVRRTWAGRPPLRRAHVESEHPECGWVTRGWIHPAGLEDNGIHLAWRIQGPEWDDLGLVGGDYRTAEKTLLEATTALED